MANPHPKINKNITADNAREYQSRGAASKRRKRTARELLDDFDNGIAERLFDATLTDYQQWSSHPKTAAEQILIQTLGDPKMAYQVLKDFKDRVQGKPKQQTDVAVSADDSIKIDCTFGGDSK